MQNLLIPVKINNVLLYFLFVLLVPVAGSAQTIDLKSDLLLMNTVAKQQVPVSSKRPYIFKNQPKTFRNSNPVSLVFGGSLYVYQNYFSQHLSASCLYSPSCSDFGKHALKEYGIVKGTLLSFDRLSRCNRISATDLNPADIDEHTHRFNDPVKLYQ
ncbi:MAG: membrane protein insertion efficiency factor YidD [Prolixibacteraceae bacterium]|nr:membrane protein insertion efficiency factor YidD [Prolixibacteraceae bacterium]